MLNVLKQRLPNGLIIDSVKILGTKYKITFAYEGGKADAELPKSCPPGAHNDVADRTIITAMSTILVNHGEFTKAQEWLDKLTEK